MSGLAPPARRDVMRNREAIVVAARAVFAEEAGGPLSHIARRAGVGQATLYRHFPNRQDLLESLLDDNLAQLESLAREVVGDPQGLFRVMTSICRMQSDTHSLFADLVSTSEQSRRRRVQTRLADLLDRPLRAAKDSALVRGDVTVRDVRRAIAMVGAYLDRVPDTSRRRGEAEAALRTVLHGMATPLG